MRYALLSVVLLSASPCLADALLDAGKLAGLLAAEEPCNLTYDQTAINNFVDETFDGDDLTAVAALGSLTRGHASLISKQSASTLAATCAAARLSAKALGFIR